MTLKIKSNESLSTNCENNKENYLFLVVLGGRAKSANVELHDVRWVVGSKIEDTMMSLEKIGLVPFRDYILIAIKKLNMLMGIR